MSPRVDLSPRQIKSLVAMRDHGSKFEDVAGRFGISLSAAQRLYKEHAPKPKSKAHK